MRRYAASAPVLVLILVQMGHACLDSQSAYRFTGTVCRLTYPAALVLNEKTTKVIEAAFQHARYPSIEGEKSMSIFGKVDYGLHNLEIYNLSIGRSEVELRPNEGVGIAISNVSAVFKGRFTYAYSWLISVSQSVDFEIESHIDLAINPRLYCGRGKVAADTSDCHLIFHKLNLHLQGDREPGWLKRIFTEFVSLTVQLVVKGQVCSEINSVANILSDFIQETAENFLSDGGIGVDISVTSAPVITSNYIESYHKGLTFYNNTKAVITASVFNPAQLGEERMLYFWISDEVMQPLMTAAHLDGRFVRYISGQELTDLFKADMSTAMPNFINQLLFSAPVLKVWSVSAPDLWTTPDGTHVKAMAAVEMTSALISFFRKQKECDVEVSVRASYEDKKFILTAKPLSISITNTSNHEGTLQAHVNYLKEAVEKIGIPKVLSYLEHGITTLLDRQGLNLFDIMNHDVIPQNGYVLIQMDFGFPHHLLVEFLRKTLE
uniref:Cholesteryl ester transfer protein n=1 Tax=Denticeps clupeoides TaxID=299321 RepID=A0AAY4DQ63_9TELE